MQLGSVRVRALRVLAGPDRWRRRIKARELEKSGGARSAAALDSGNLDREGFSLAVLEDAARQKLLDDWATLKGRLGMMADRGKVVRQTGKVFFEELLSVADLGQLPAFLATAIDEHVLTSVTRAMGMVPHLESVDILASKRVDDSLSSSQLWHYDVNDERILKLFVYLEDTWALNGPFTYIDASSSQRVRGALGHYVGDDRISVHVPREQWHAVEGAAGTAFLIDTGRCYHFGSRCELPRYAYIATYSSGLKFMRRANIWRDVLERRAQTLSPLQREVCGLL